MACTPRAQSARLTGGRWVDNAFRSNMPSLNLEAFSDEYFDVLEKEPAPEPENEAETEEQNTNTNVNTNQNENTN